MRRVIQNSSGIKGNLYIDTDFPQDFIHIEPVMLNKTLPIKPIDPNQLSTFAGAKIWFGFKLVDVAKYQTSAIETSFPKADIKPLIDQIIETGQPPDTRIITIESFESLKNMECVVSLCEASGS